MLLIPFRRVRLSAAVPPQQAAAAITELCESAPDWLFFLFPQDVAGYRLQGIVDRGRVRLVVLPRRWYGIPYLPVASGTLAERDGGSVLTLAFRPNLPEIVSLLALSGLALGSGAPMWFGLGMPCLYHVLGCTLGFTREVNRVVSILRWALRGRVGVPRFEDGAAEQGVEADEA